jgi:hypothetical protein
MSALAEELIYRTGLLLGATSGVLAAMGLLSG